jgi:hypothetical protein
MPRRDGARSPGRDVRDLHLGFGRWWRRSGPGIGRAPLQTAIIEPFISGRWYEIGADGTETDWGKALAWKPSSRLLLAWQIGTDWQFHPDLVTEVEVRFTPEGRDATCVDLEHRHVGRLGEGAPRLRTAIAAPNSRTGKLGIFVKPVAEGIRMQARIVLPDRETSHPSAKSWSMEFRAVRSSGRPGWGSGKRRRPTASSRSIPPRTGARITGSANPSAGSP